MNQGSGLFVERTTEAGDAFTPANVSRGVAVGDVDNDGDSDIVITNNAGPARLLLNEMGNEQPWFGLRLLSGRRDALGATVTAERKGASPLLRRSRTDGSYCSSNDPRVLVAPGNYPDVTGLVIQWPDGQTERLGPPPIDQYISVIQGQGYKNGESQQ